MITIPNNPLCILSYAQKCDIVLMRDQAQQFIQNNILSDIKSNDVICCWSSYLPHLFDYLSNSLVYNITLLSGDNDHSVNPNGSNTFHNIPRMPKNITKWYAQNAEVVNDIMIPLPIGLIPPWRVDMPYITDSLGLRENLLVNAERNKLLYSNFNIDTNPKERSSIRNTIIKNFGINTEYSDIVDYYRNIQEHKFIVCPPGNGKDTHRMWESLYFGAIPIVEDIPMNRYFASLFPVVVTKGWDELTVDFLENYKFDQNSWKYHLLDVDNWFKMNKIGDLKI